MEHAEHRSFGEREEKIKFEKHLLRLLAHGHARLLEGIVIQFSIPVIPRWKSP